MSFGDIPCGLVCHTDCIWNIWGNGRGPHPAGLAIYGAFRGFGLQNDLGAFGGDGL